MQGQPGLTGQPPQQGQPGGMPPQSGGPPTRQQGRPPTQGVPGQQAGGASPMTQTPPAGSQQMGSQQMQGTPPQLAGQQVQPGAPGAGGMQAGQPGMQQASMAPQLQPISLENIIQTDVVTAERDTPIRTIVAKMAEREVGCVVLVEDEKPIGLLTDRKIALTLEETPDLADRTAEELLSEELVTGQSDMTFFEVIDRLNEAGVRRLPIVDEDDETLAGIVSLDDILVVLGVELRNAAGIIEEQSPRL